MEESIIRQQIIDTCKFLQEKGLIARTWGNVSARLNEKEFIITPSGLSYDLTTKDDLVIVNIDDCSYAEIQRKPSSEKGVHASIYRNRKDINFIIHTHQHYASAVCADESSITLSDNTFVPCADYGLPGQKKLMNNCENIVKTFPNANMFLMAKHGVVIYGTNKDETIESSLYLENECEKIFSSRVKEFVIPNKMKAYLDDYAQMFPLSKNEDVEAAKIIEKKNAAAMLYAKNSKPLGFIDRNIQHIVYKLKYSKMRDKK